MKLPNKRIIKHSGQLIVIDWKKNVSSIGGPPEELKSDPAQIKSEAQSIGLKFVNDFDAGQYHFGITFVK